MNNDFSVKKKLELMQQIRSRYQKDKYDMSHREKILYGRTSDPRNENTYADDRYGSPPQFSTLSLRIFLAAAALALIVLSDRTGSAIFGISAKQCFQAISEDYESSIAAWADAASRAILNSKTATDNKANIDDEASVNDKNNSGGPLKENPPAGSRP